MQTAFALPAPVPMPVLIAPSMVPLPETAGGTKPAPLLLFGIDDRGRPHGACFVVSETAAVERAADLMDLYFVAAETDALRELGVRLPKGRLYPGSGKAFVPFIKAALYEQLLAASGTLDNQQLVQAASKPAGAGASAGAGHGSGAGGSGAGGPPATSAEMKAIADSSDIKLGSLVLAKGDDEEGYYAATVVAKKANDHFVLIWLGYDLPEFPRPRRALALLHPEATAEVG